jgi:hypothetical protein
MRTILVSLAQRLSRQPVFGNDVFGQKFESNGGLGKKKQTGRKIFYRNFNRYSSVTVISKNVDFKHKIEGISILNHFRIAVSHISICIGFTPSFEKLSKNIGAAVQKIQVFYQLTN